MKTFCILMFTTNLIIKHLTGNSAWTDQKKKKKCASHTNRPAGHHLLLCSIETLEISPLPNRSILCANLDGSLQWLSRKAALDQWTLLVQLDVNPLRKRASDWAGQSRCIQHSSWSLASLEKGTGSSPISCTLGGALQSPDSSLYQH